MNEKDMISVYSSVHNRRVRQRQRQQGREKASTTQSWHQSRLNPNRKRYNKIPDHGITDTLPPYTSYENLSLQDPRIIVRYSEYTPGLNFNYCTTSLAVAIAELPLTEPASLHSPQFP